MVKSWKLTFVVALALALGAVAGCTGVDGELDLATPEPRPSDGVLADEELQSIVAHQIAREWEPLAEALGHDRAEVRARAALALASVQAYQAVPALAELLTDADASVRRDAAFALGQSAQPEAADPLLSALATEGEAPVRHRMLEALGKLGFDEVVEGLLALELTGQDQADQLLALGRLGAIQGKVTPESQDFMLSKLEDPDPRIREAAAYFFGRSRDPSGWAARASRVRRALDGYRMGDPAAMHLVKALAALRDPADVARLKSLAGGSPDWRIRAEAMAALGGRALDETDKDVLLAGLNDTNVHVAVNAASALAGVSHLPSTLGRLAAWVEGNPDRWQVAAPLLSTLARQNQQEFVLGWVDGLQDSDEPRRAAGLAALGRMRGIEALQRIRPALASESDRVASAAVRALRQRWGEDEGDPRQHENYFILFSEALATGRPQAVAVAGSVLGNPVFQPFGSVAVLTEALNALDRDDVDEAALLLGALGSTGDLEAETALRWGMAHPYQSVRQAAAAALGQLTGEDVAPPSGGAEDPEAPDEVGAMTWDPQVVDWAYLASLGATPRLILETERGTVVVRLSPEEAPQTVQSMARLAQEGRFDGTPFHRVVPNFVAQGGDVGNRDGSGGAGYSIRTEITGIPFRRGAIGMASAGMDTESSQFFLMHSAAPHLDGGYTAFGWVVEGAEVMDAIRQGDLLVSARIE